MSIAIEVYLQQHRLPSVEAWQKSITQADFDLTLDILSPLQEQSGFQPVLYNGFSTGFELYFGSVEDGLDPLLLQAIGDRGLVATFRFGGDINEAKAATVASGALAQLCDGILYDTESGTFVSGPDAAACPKSEIEAFKYSETVASENEQREAARVMQKRAKKWWRLWR